MNRNAEATGNQMMVFWFFFLLIIIAGGIFLGALIFFGYGYEFREAEAGILNYKIINCLNSKVVNWEDNDSFYLNCGMSRKILAEELENNKLVIKICEGNCDNGRLLFQVGSNFESCDFIGKNEKYMRCVRDFTNNGVGSFEVLTGSNHFARRTNA